MNYEVRRAGANDSRGIVALVHALLSELRKTDLDWNFDYFVAICNMIISDDDNGIFIALDRGKEIGVITVVQSIAIYSEGKFGVINEFYVSPEYRSSGIGHLLLDSVINFGISKKWSRIEVGAPNEKDWKPTIDFYIREGFITIGPRLKKVLSS